MNIYELTRFQMGQEFTNEWLAGLLLAQGLSPHCSQDADSVLTPGLDIHAVSYLGCAA